MRKTPDKRVWLFLGAVFVLAILSFYVRLGESLRHLMEIVLCLVCALGAICIGVYSIRDGYSWFRPSTTREEWPMLFWMDVMVGCFLFAGIAVWKVYGMFKNVL